LDESGRKKMTSAHWTEVISSRPQGRALGGLHRHFKLTHFHIGAFIAQCQELSEKVIKSR
jgi:hypothetical protein